MQIMVQLYNTTVTLEVDLLDTIGVLKQKVKQKVEQQTGIAEARLNPFGLTYGGKPLENDDFDLKAYNIQNMSTLWYHVRPPPVPASTFLVSYPAILSKEISDNFGPESDLNVSIELSIKVPPYCSLGNFKLSVRENCMPEVELDNFDLEFRGSIDGASNLRWGQLTSKFGPEKPICECGLDAHSMVEVCLLRDLEVLHTRSKKRITELEQEVLSATNAAKTKIAAANARIRRLEQEVNSVTKKAESKIEAANARITMLTQERDEFEGISEKANSALDAMVLQCLSHLPRKNSYTRYGLSELDKASPIFEFLKSKILASLVQHRRSYGDTHWCPAPQIEVQRIERVFNPRLLDEYAVAQNRVMGLSRNGATKNVSMDHGIVLDPAYGVNLNEALLFHGAKDHDLICRAGFDPRRGGQTAGRMFGAGSYFGENFSKADQYAGEEPFVRNKGTMCVLIARVLLGESHATKAAAPDWAMPPLRDPDNPYDSVWAMKRAEGGCVDFREYIVYCGGQALPYFRVWYRHSEACDCSRCSRESN